MINVNGVQPPVGPKAVEPVSPGVIGGAPVQATKASDVVEISTVARLAAMAQEVPEIRTDLVARIKAEIEAGTYETPERIDIAVNRLMDELLGEM
jgi:negative regulator of flagellin synthesis FlgM